MSATEIISAFSARGIAVSLNDAGGLRVVPASLLTDEDRQALRDHKAELIALLQSQSEPGNGDAGATPAPEPEAVEEFALTPQDVPEPPRLGSCARPMPIRGTRMPPDCPWHTCNGTMSQRGYTRGECTLGYCQNCDTWFELLPPEDLGVYLGDLADDIDRSDASEWVM